MDVREQRRFGYRVRFLLACFCIGLGLVFVRSFQLQVVQHGHLDQLAREEYMREVRVPARRGVIADRKGVALASSTQAPSLFADPTKITDPRGAARRLSKLLDVDLDTVYQRLASDRHFVWLRRRVSPALAEAAMALGIEGVAITHEPKRVYPNGQVGAHLLGFVGVDSEGLEGIERQLDHVLLGEPQVVSAVRDARGRAVLDGGLDPEQAAAGADVRLTLDLPIQHVAQRALVEAVRSTRSVAGVAVVLGVQDADVLAMAVAPSFDPNDASSVSASRRRNRALTDMFEPGSTLKPLVVAAALEAGVIKPSDPFFGENGSLRIGAHTIRDSKPIGWMGLDTLIAKSSNIGAVKVGQALGRSRMHEALVSYGFGERTGVQFPGEAAGMVRPAKTWSDVGLATMSFGHGLAVTPLQLAAAYRVLAAGGEYRSPRLIDSIERPDGARVRTAEPVVRQVLSVDVAARVTRMMRKVVSPDGTGWRAAVPGYLVAGKTGTAQKIDPVSRGYSTDRFIASFAGFLPADAPRAVIVVALDEPQQEHTGGAVAAPVFAEIAKATMLQLGVVPSESVAAADPSEETRQNEAQDEAVAALDMPVGGPGQVPSFIGMTSRQVVERFVELSLGLDLEMVGTGTVVQQSPRAGTPRVAAKRVKLVLAQR